MMVKAIGNTYGVRDALKAVGFVWNKDEKSWEAEKEEIDMDAWTNKYCKHSYIGRKIATLANEIQFVEK